MDEVPIKDSVRQAVKSFLLELKNFKDHLVSSGAGGSCCVLLETVGQVLPAGAEEFQGPPGELRGRGEGVLCITGERAGRQFDHLVSGGPGGPLLCVQHLLCVM